MVQRPHPDKRLLPQSPDYLHEIHGSQRFSGNVNHTLSSQKRQPPVGMVCPVSHAGLPDIVPGGPHKVADDLRQSFYPLPVVGKISSHGLGSHHDTIRILLRVRLIPGRSVVQADDIQRFRRSPAGPVSLFPGAHKEHQRSQFLGHGIEESGPCLLLLIAPLPRKRLRPIISLIPIHPQSHIGIDIQQHVDSGGNRPAPIQSMDKLRHFPTGLYPFFRGCLRHLISNGIENHTGMISRSIYHGRQIPPPLTVEHSGIIMIGLRHIPAVKCLVHHIHAQSVTEFQRHLGGRIVRHADGVETTLLQNSDAPLLSIVKFTGSQNTMVMMDTSAPQQHTLPVDRHSLFCAPLQGTDAKGNPLLIPRDAHQTGVKIRFLSAPEFRAFQDYFPGRANIQPLPAIINFHSDRQRSLLHIRPARSIFPRYFHLHKNLRRADGCCLNLYSLNMHFLANPKRHRPVNAGTGIPAAVRLQGIVHGNRNFIFSRTRLFGEIHIKGRVSISVLSHFCTIQLHNTILIYTLEVKHNRFGRLLLRQNKFFLIAIFPSGKIPAVHTIRTAGVPFFGYHGIMGQRYLQRIIPLSVKDPIIIKIHLHLSPSLLHKIAE